MRVGLGYDVHRLVEGRKLVLGGETIPFTKGLLGHSDADVLVHAVCDALLGAAGLGDIGLHFSDDDPEYKDVFSIKLLEKSYKIVIDKGFSINNVDATVFAEAPRLAPFRGKMENNIARALAMDESRVNIKATTFEGLGMIGKGEGIASMATLLLNEL